MKKGVTKTELYRTRGLISIAALLGISEQLVNRIHDEYVRGLEGTRFSHKRFINYLLDDERIINERIWAIEARQTV